MLNPQMPIKTRIEPYVATRASAESCQRCSGTFGATDMECRSVGDWFFMWLFAQ